MNTTHHRSISVLLATAALLTCSALVAPAAHADPAPSSTESTGSTMTRSHDRVPTAQTAALLDTVGDLVLRRLELADPVAQSKWLSGKPVADPAREQAVVDAAVALADRRGIDPVLVTRMLRAQIAASKVVQRGRINQWTHNPWTAPTTAPDLGTIRPQLDEIDSAMVTALGSVQSTPTVTHCAHLVDAERDRLYPGLDSLQRKAMHVAWNTFCAS